MAGLRRSLSLALALMGGAASFSLAVHPARTLAQDMVGCQIVDGLLSCVPGVSPQPQAQIKALRAQIATDIQLEGAVQQQIDGLQQLVLTGQAREGQLLQASLSADALAGLPPSAFHWYRLAPGSKQWVLIQGATGPTYAIQSTDVAGQVMLVVAQPTPNGSQRQATPPVGPIKAASAP